MMDASHEHKPGVKVAPFDTVLGRCLNIDVHSCDYDSVDGLDSRWKSPDAFRSEHTCTDGNVVVCGYKWQCVELARRYLLINHGLIFDSIPMAYDIMGLKCVRRVSDGQLFKMDGHDNGSSVHPRVGSLLIWKPKGFFKVTGHVAVISAVHSDSIEIIEQNVEDAVWPDGINYSRLLKTETASDGSFTIHCTYDDTSVLGWMNVYPDQAYEFEDLKKHNCIPTDIELRAITLPDSDSCKEKGPWLDDSVDYIATFIETYGPELGEFSADAPYYVISESGEAGIRAASEELHKLFIDGTDYALTHQTEVKQYFMIPEKVWPLIRKSWYRRKNDIVAGRFDYSITEKGVKCYEYNADSASALLECGMIQGKWGEAVGLSCVGRDVGEGLFNQLVETWKSKDIKGTLHILCDQGGEEMYHTLYMQVRESSGGRGSGSGPWTFLNSNMYPTLYMQSAARAAGVVTKLVVGQPSGWFFNGDGRVLDQDGMIIDNIWKTWAWRTIIDSLAAVNDLDYYVDLLDDKSHQAPKPTGPPQLYHATLDHRVRVFEPLWTILPASKAILPILCRIRPGHPFLIRSSYELTEEMKASGYVAKPASGRAGKSISVFGPEGQLMSGTTGQWDDDQIIYQDLCQLPIFGGEFVQFNAWAVGAAYGGTVIRHSTNLIIDYDSAVAALRVVKDDELLQQSAGPCLGKTLARNSSNLCRPRSCSLSHAGSYAGSPGQQGERGRASCRD